MNLALNAAEAIGSHEGVIAVRTGVEEWMNRKATPPGDGGPGAGAIRFSRSARYGLWHGSGDQGPDLRSVLLHEVHRARAGAGGGLGHCGGHNGAIVVDSAPGQGSCFTVWFPAAGRDAASPPDAESGAPPKGAGAVMVVDDEAARAGDGQEGPRTPRLHGAAGRQRARGRRHPQNTPRRDYAGGSRSEHAAHERRKRLCRN